MKRRAFDSVDPTFDNAVPSKGEGKENFFQVFAPVFDRNARWSSKKHVPKLGTMESSFEDVDNFYSFWWVVFKRRWFDYRKMLCQNTTQGSVLTFVPFFKKKKKIVKGTTLIHGGNSHTWMKRKRKKLNGKLPCVCDSSWFYWNTDQVTGSLWLNYPTDVFLLSLAVETRGDGLRSRIELPELRGRRRRWTEYEH